MKVNLAKLVETICFVISAFLKAMNLIQMICRVSTIDQNLDIRLDALNNAGCKKIFSKKKAALQKNRTALGECIEYIHKGDTLVVTRIDRLTCRILVGNESTLLRTTANTRPAMIIPWVTWI